MSAAQHNGAPAPEVDLVEKGGQIGLMAFAGRAEKDDDAFADAACQRGGKFGGLGSARRFDYDIHAAFLCHGHQDLSNIVLGRVYRM